jgi:hypothetical protein
MAVAGTGKRPLHNNWRAPQAQWAGNPGDVHRSSSRPTIRVGDRLVMYACGSQRFGGAGRFFAVREVESEPVPNDVGTWHWELALREVIGGPDLDRCPTIDQIGVAAISLRNKSYIRLKDAAAGPLAEQLLTKALADNS